MTEKNVDKIKIGDNIIGSNGEIISGNNVEKVSGNSAAAVSGNYEEVTAGNIAKIVSGSGMEITPENSGGIVSESSTGLVSGIVKWFSPEKGFGFVTCSNSMDIFVYYTEIQIDGFKTLQKGQKVQLEIFSGERGYQASNVRLI